jgi:hypothetical protein
VSAALFAVSWISWTTFYHVQVGTLETQEFRTTLVPFWLVCFTDTIKELAAGWIALFFANRLGEKKAVGATLALVGLVTTIPAVWAIFGNCE